MYRGEVHGLLPFELKGLDAAVPTIDFSPVGSSEIPYSLQRSDIEGKGLFVSRLSYQGVISMLTRDFRVHGCLGRFGTVRTRIAISGYPRIN